MARHHILALSVLAWASVPLAPAALADEAKPAEKGGGEAKDQGPGDPIENANRAVFDGNQYIDRHVLKPMAGSYRETVPSGVQRGVSNVLNNLREPSIAVNDLLQGNPARALSTLWRFTVNTTAGALGILDVAGDLGLEHHEADFGQTLGVWGAGTGPYLTLPLLGPSNLRDATGTLVGFVLNPLPLGPAQAPVSVSQALDQRVQAQDQLDTLERSSVDFYASLRSAYLQRRQALVADGKTPGSLAIGTAAPAIEIEPSDPVSEPALESAPAPGVAPAAVQTSSASDLVVPPASGSAAAKAPVERQPLPPPATPAAPAASALPATLDSVDLAAVLNPPAIEPLASQPASTNILPPVTVP